MLRHLLLAPLAALVLLAGCMDENRPSGTTLGGAIGTIGGAVIEKYAPEQLASAVKDHCGLIITAGDWFGLSEKFPDLGDGMRAVCDSFKKVAAARRSSGATGSVTVLVRGVPVSGYFQAR